MSEPIALRRLRRHRVFRVAAAASTDLSLIGTHEILEELGARYDGVVLIGLRQRSVGVGGHIWTGIRGLGGTQSVINLLRLVARRLDHGEGIDCQRMDKPPEAP